MKQTMKTLGLLIIGFTLAKFANAQCDTVANVCAQHLTGKFISDGQEYRALLIDNETAEFTSTFYGNSTYRVCACSGLTEGNLNIKIYDSEHHELFDNGTFQNASHWDFKFNSTVNCTIEAKLFPSNSATSAGSGCAVVLIGFKTQ